MAKTLSAAALFLVLSSPAQAAAPAWSVDKAASKLEFTASMNGAAFTGHFARWDAVIHFDPAALDASDVTATIDMTSAATGDQTRDEALPTSDWFNAAKFPRATFAAHSFKDLGNGKYQAAGELTIRGVKQPATLGFLLNIQNDVAAMKGGLTLDRRSFGVGQGQFSGTEAVPAAVQVNVTLTARKAK